MYPCKNKQQRGPIVSSYRRTKFDKAKRKNNMAEEVFDIGQAATETIQEQRAPSAGVEPGVYDAILEKAYIRTTDSGAKMVEFQLKVDEDKKLFYSTCVMSKAKKTTYTNKDGKEMALPGVNELVAVEKLLTGNPQIKGTVELVEHKDNNIKAMVLKELEGKPVKIGVREEQSYYNGNLMSKPVITQWMDLEGKNEKGEEVEEKVYKSIQKNPVKKPKGRAPQAEADPQAAREDMAGKGW